MEEHFKCFSVKVLDYYNITVHSLVCNKLNGWNDTDRTKHKYSENDLCQWHFVYFVYFV